MSYMKLFVLEINKKYPLKNPNSMVKAVVVAADEASARRLTLRYGSTELDRLGENAWTNKLVTDCTLLGEAGTLYNKPQMIMRSKCTWSNIHHMYIP
jgi:hypothetical protein